MNDGSQGWVARAAAGIGALALLLAGIAVVDRVQGPSDSECSTQRLEVVSGKRVSVEDDCR